jgi:photosystem II stability/assembly factor-like uncharacterized protein
MKKRVSRRGSGRRTRRPASGTEASRLDPPPARRDDGDEAEDETENFRRRAEWWREYHGDQSGVVSGELRTQAIAHAEAIAARGLDNPDPGGARPRGGFELVSRRGNAKAKAVLAKNPRPRSSAGFVSEAVTVRGPADLDGMVLKIALDPKRLPKVEPSTVRVFCFDAASTEWQLIPRSGARVEAGYAWAHLHRPGIYVAIGLRAGADALAELLTLRTLMPRVRAAEGRAGRRRALGLARQLLSRRRAGRSRAAAAATGSATGLDIAALDIGTRGLPEFDLLDDICPPALPPGTKNAGKEIIQRLRWDDILVDVDSIVLFREWCSVGPRNFSGRIKSLSIHPVEGNGLLAGAADGGVWRTHDGGLSWLPLMSQELSMAIGAVVRSGANLSVIYAATGEDTPGWAPSYPGVGVYKSVNGGNSWTLLAPISSTRCTRLLLHPTNENIVYVAGDAGLHKTTDGGLSWTRLRFDHVCDAVMDPSFPDTIYAAVWMSGIFRSTNGGATWSDFNEGLPTGTAADWIKIAASKPATDGSVVLVAKMAMDSGQVFRRRVHVPPVIGTAARRRAPARGVLARRLPARRVLGPELGPFPPFTFDEPWQMLPGTHEPAAYNEWTNMVAVHPTQRNVIFAGGIGVKRSTNGGTTFAQVTGTHSDHHEVVFARLSSDLCYMATDGGVYRSVDNGATWTLTSTGLVATQLYSVGVSQTAPFLLGGGTQDQGIIKTVGPADWSDTGAGNEGGFFVVDPRNSNNVYVTPWSHNLRRSTDGGNSWTTILNGITQTGDPPRAVSVRHLAVCPTDSNLLLCAAGNEVFRSSDQGANWTSVLQIAAAAMRVAWYGQNICYAASNDGEVFRSKQQGASGSWSKPYTDANRPPTGTIVAIEPRFVEWEIAQAVAGRRVRRAAGPGDTTVPFRRDFVYIAYSWGGRVYKSTDGGAHWANASGSGAGALPNIPISALVIDAHLSDTVYIATDIGVFRTLDGGANWQPFNDGMPRIVVSGLALRARDNTLYCSTMGRGAYQRVLT